MPNPDEIKVIRLEVEHLMRRAESLAKRLDALEEDSKISDVLELEAAEVRHVTPMPVVPAALEIRATPAKPLAPALPVAPRPAPVPRAPGLVERGLKELRRLGPPEDMGIEMALWTWWMPRVGITVLAVGVVWLMTYAVNRWGQPWMPYFRVAGGYGICAALLGIGFHLERKAANYARVLLGGGMALTYFVTFSTHFVTYTKIIGRPEPVLLMLAGIALAYVSVAHVRRSVLVALGGVLLGHLTILVSTLTLPEPSPVAVAGLLGLAGACAFFLVAHGWRWTALAGLAASYTNHFAWLARSPGGDTLLEFAMAMSVLTGYFLIFAGADLAASERERSRLRSVYVSLNSVAFFAMGLLMMKAFPFTEDRLYLFHFTFGAALALIGVVYWRLRTGDPVFNAYFVKASVAITLGLATYFEGSTLTVALAVEAVALLFSARASGLVVTRILAHGAGILAFVHGCSVFMNQPGSHWGDPNFVSRAVEYLGTVLAFLAFSELYRRTDWAARSPRKPAILRSYAKLWWDMDLLAEEPEGAGPKGGNGLAFPNAYALAGGGLWVIAAHRLLEQGYWTMALGSLALGATAAGVALGSRSFGLLALALIGVSIPDAFLDFSRETKLDWGSLALVPLALVALTGEAAQLGGRAGMLWRERQRVAYLVYGVFALNLVFAILLALPPAQEAVALGIAAAVLAALALALNPRALAACACALVVCASVSWAEMEPPWRSMSSTHPILWHAGAWEAALLALAIERYCAYRSIFKRSFATWLLLAVACWVFCAYSAQVSGPYWKYLWWAVVGFGFLGYGVQFRLRAAYVLAGITAACATWALVGRAHGAAWEHSLIAGYAALILFWGTAEWGARRARARKSATLDQSDQLRDGILVAVASGLLVLLLARIPMVGSFYLAITWTVAAVAMLGAAVLTQQKYYRYAGLLTFCLAIGRVFLIDRKQLDPVYQIIGAIFLGIVLLAVAYGFILTIRRSDKQGLTGLDAELEETQAKESP